MARGAGCTCTQETQAEARSSRSASGPTLIVLLMQGLPGSGKSTVARRLAAEAKRAAIFSTDEYFERPDGTYAFSFNRIGYAHEWNQARVEARLAASAAAGLDDLVIVDNTNMTRRDVEPYFASAARHGAIVRVECVDTPVEVCL